jgi:hypothetical protein
VELPLKANVPAHLIRMHFFIKRCSLCFVFKKLIYGKGEGTVF